MLRACLAGERVTGIDADGNVTCVPDVDTNTVYTAGDGLDLVDEVFSVNLKTSGGFKIEATELAVESSDLAGAGLEDDGFDRLRLSVSDLLVDTNSGSLDDAIAIADASDSNLTKKITLSELKSVVAGFHNGTGLTLTGTEFSVTAGGITTTELANLSVTNAKLGLDSVSTDRLQNAVVTTPKLAAEAVTEPKLASDAVVAGKVAENVITARELALDAVETANLLDGAVNAAKVDPSQVQLRVDPCPAGSFIASVNVDGSVNCGTFDGSTFALSDQGCGPGEQVVGVDDTEPWFVAPTRIQHTMVLILRSVTKPARWDSE